MPSSSTLLLVFNLNSSSLPSALTHCTFLHLSLPFPSVPCHFSTFSSPLSSPASHSIPFSFSSFICYPSPHLLISLVCFNTTVQTRLSARSASCHVLPWFSFGDHSFCVSLCMRTRTRTHTRPILIIPSKSQRDGLTNLAFCRSYADTEAQTWAWSPWDHALPGQPSL